ncbi:hypothetical protein MRB76_000178 [Shigella flexneri]|nr:hypothetical protein [Shigella flexneri]EIZ9552734.1 hypothetical protein [Shigella flexneri]
MEKYATERRRHVIKRDDYYLEQLLEQAVNDIYSQAEDDYCLSGWGTEGRQMLMRNLLQEIADVVLSDIDDDFIDEYCEERSLSRYLIVRIIGRVYYRIVQDMEFTKTFYRGGTLSSIRVWSATTFGYEYIFK